MKKVIKEISNGINLEMNLPAYANYLVDLYNKSAVVELTMEYYTYYEMLEEQEYGDENLKACADIVNDIIQSVIIPGKVDAEREKAIAGIDGLRNEIYKKVDSLAAYADIFSRYEYVSNRCEYLFKDADFGSGYSDDDFTRQIMQYIFSEEDNTVINSKISEMIAEVPLRMTKSKFFQLLSEGLTVYNQTDQQTVDDFIYGLKSSSMLVLPEHMEEFRDLHEIYLYAKNLNYDTITEAQFHELEQKLNYAAVFIEEKTNLYTMLQGIINKTYAILICLPYASFEQQDIACCMKIIQAVSEQFKNPEYRTLADDVTELFRNLEGIPEELHSRLSSVEYVLDHVKEQHMDIVKSIMAEKIYHGLFLIQCLLSDSLFIDLSAVREGFDNKTETEAFDIKAYVARKRDELIAELTEFFKDNQKIVNRSVMALILSRLPVFFNNITEIQDYIYHSLSNCTNKAEKTAVVEIIKCIINEI